MTPVARPKVPAVPPRPLTRTYADLVESREVLWRVHRTLGEHVLPWRGLRRFGPLASMRWDPQPPPPGLHETGVLYAATDLATALAEVFGMTRLVDTGSFAPQATAWRPTRPLSLLNLTESWALRNGAAAALGAARRSTCRAWAREIRATWPELDGLWVTSTMTGHPNVVLWDAAADSFPAAPEFSRPLADPTLKAIVSRIARSEIGYDCV